MKKVLLFVSIGLLLLAIPATIFFLGQQRDLRAKAAPATTLAFTPPAQTVNVGDTFKLTVTMNPGSNQVLVADLHITYDATKLTATAITNGTNAPRVLNSGVIENGTATIRVSAASATQPITTAGPIAVVTFTATAPTTAIAPAAADFASTNFVAAINESTVNVLVGSTGAKITINGVAPTNTPSPTLTPTLTPTIAATNSGQATASALTILSPSANEDVTTTEPVIHGKAPAGSTVTIVIHSSPQTAVVTTDANGNWTYTPTTPLDSGPHDITASVLTAGGTTETSSTSFVVVAGAGLGGGSGSDSAMPVSGNIETTLFLIGIGALLVVSGALIPVFIK